MLGLDIDNGVLPLFISVLKMGGIGIVGFIATLVLYDAAVKRAGLFFITLLLALSVIACVYFFLPSYIGVLIELKDLAAYLLLELFYGIIVIFLLFLLITLLKIPEFYIIFFGISSFLVAGFWIFIGIHNLAPSATELDRTFVHYLAPAYLIFSMFMLNWLGRKT